MDQPASGLCASEKAGPKKNEENVENNVDGPEKLVTVPNPPPNGSLR
jgi:hypothetical protein